MDNIQITEKETAFINKFNNEFGTMEEFNDEMLRTLESVMYHLDSKAYIGDVRKSLLNIMGLVIISKVS